MSSSNTPLASPIPPTSQRNSTLNSTIPSESTATSELGVVIDDLLNQLSTKFSSISEELLGKMDEMSRRLDGLEAAIQAAGKSAPESK